MNVPPPSKKLKKFQCMMRVRLGLKTDACVNLKSQNG